MASVENGGAAAPKIRLVQCPRCRQILRELPNVPVYQCGGCGIHLQAKIRPRNGETNSTSADSARLSRLESTGSSSVHLQPDVPPDSSVKLNDDGEAGGSNSVVDRELSVKDQVVEDDEVAAHGGNSACSVDSTTSVDDANDDGVKLIDDGETGGSDHDEIEEISKDECGDQQVEDEVAAHGENAAYSTDHSTTSAEKQEMSPDVGVDSESEVSIEIPKVFSMLEDHSEARRSSSDNVNEETIEAASTVIAIRPASASISGGVLASPPNRMQERVRFDPVHNADTLEEADDFVSSELSGMLVDLTKSPTTRSCHAYYDGISEGTDDQVPGRLRPYSRNAQVHKPESYMIAEEKAESARNNLGLQYQQKKYHSPDMDLDSDYVLPSRKNLEFQYQQKKYHSPDTNLDSEELRGVAVLNNPVKSWGRLESDDELPRNSYMNGYESGSTLYQSQSGLRSNLSSHPRVNAADIEQERIRLLRMVYELEDQLTRSCSLNNNVSRTVFSGNVRRDDEHVPFNYGTDRRPYSREITSWSQQQQRQPSRIPFSAEVDNHSSCCNRQEWKCSGQLPTHCLNHNRVFCRAHSGLSSCNSYGSCPSSPQRCAGSEYSSSSIHHGRATMSCEQRHGRDSRDLNRYIREKQHFTGAAKKKRHIRPIAGGAPLLACHFCLKQLQLPADFLVSKRKSHTLKCGACSEILKFSLVNKTHLVPNFTEEEDHAPRRTSFHHAASRSMANSSSGSFKHGEQRQQNKAIIPDKLIKSNGKSPVETHHGTGPSYSPKNDKEEIQGRGGSPLHRLMGYSTLSGVLRRN